MTRRMVAALVRANEVAYRRWLESTRLEEAFLGDPFLCGDEDAMEVKHFTCDCPRCQFRRLSDSGGRTIQ